MLRILFSIGFLLFSVMNLHASVPKPPKKAPSLRQLRSQLITQKPATLAAVVSGAAQIVKTAQENPTKAIQAFTQEQLKAMQVTVSDEEAKDHKLSSTNVSIVALLGKKAVGSTPSANGISDEVDHPKYVRLGYRIVPSVEHQRGDFVLVYMDKKYWYGVVVAKKDETSYLIQFEGHQVAHVSHVSIASKKQSK